MKIAAFSDIHLPGCKDFDFYHALKDLSGSTLDVLILAGDISAAYNNFDLTMQKINSQLKDFNITASHKLFVPGNHDIHLDRGDSLILNRIKSLVSNQNLSNEQAYLSLRDKASRLGYHMLDASPYLVGNTAFVGNIGWYDYSFGNNSDLELLVGNTKKPIREFTKHDYSLKKVYEEQSKKTIYWPDKTDFDDVEFAKKQAQSLEKDLISVKGKDIFVVLHTVPFIENISKQDTIFKQFTSAYMGSELFREIILKHNVSTVIHGHSHLGTGKYLVGNTTAYNVAFKKSITIIDYNPKGVE